MKKIRVGILGQGRSGYNIHASWLRNDQERYQIVAVADQLPERTKECVTDFGAKAFDDYEALLADKTLNLDLVVNSLPSFLHPEGTRKALQAGYDVICEKPVARTVADFDSMVATAEACGKKLLPFQNSRFRPAFKKIQSIIDSGCLGRIIEIRMNYSGFSRRWDWQARRDMWGGNLLNTGPHPMDHAIVLFGEDTPNVFARLVSDNPFGDAENYASVTLWGEGAPTIQVVVSSFMAYPQGETYNIQGTCGGLTGTFTDLKWKYFNPETAPQQACKGTWSDDRSYCKDSLIWEEKSWKIDADPDGLQGRFTVAEAFYDDAYGILTEHAPRVITLDQVRRQIAVMEEAHRQNPNLR